ncbi:MAG TPA: adenylate/guanylate cyclase domain-containing protein, partial [Anaerolineales bacterium]
MEREQLEQAIAALEAQRAALGESVADQAIASLREKLAALQPETAGAAPASSRPGAPTAVRRTGERRVITILFCDVKGSTAMAEKLDPEEWAGIIRPAIDYLIEPVERHGGTVTQVMGDGLLALFGAPLAHEDDPRRAVQAGLEIVERIRSYHDQIQRERGLNFDVRVGIHTGLAVVQEVGSGQKVDYTAIGDTVNLAARMEQTARPGTVQVSSQTHRFVEQIFEFEPLGEIQVKGKRDRVETYRVTGVKAEPGPLRGLEQQGLHSPLVGREAELSAAQKSVARLRAGQGGLLGILGEAGVGKSRLLAELQRTLPVDELYWLEGHTLSYGQTISYWPFQEILRCFADINDSDEEDLAWCKLESTVTALFPENVDGSAPTVAEIAPYLASLMGLKVKGEYAERVIYLDGEAMGRQIFLAARRFFERLAQTRPVVLVIDDLHWVDESSVRLLEHLLPLVQSVPLLVIGLSRRDRESAAAQLADTIRRDYAAHYTEIQLEPLSESDSARLVRNLLELESLPGQVQKLITGKAEGNPFYLEEILRALMDLGAIRREATSGRWTVTAQIEGLDIPDTVQGVILA